MVKSLLLSGLLSLSLLLTGRCAMAQSAHTISGKVTGENQKPLAGATVFVDGSQIATATNSQGKYEITVPGAGSYHLSVKMLGYGITDKDVMLKNQTANLDFTLAVTSIKLHEVKIGSDKAWAQHYAVFKKEFLGTTGNARGCEILNPEIINFSTSKDMLYADADDFLIIENKKLGYRIKYLLKTFEHSALAHTAYNGDVVFEELPGTDDQKRQWAKNRLETYKGSMMHFLRSVFTNTTEQEGFVAYKMVSFSDYDTRPVKFDSLVTAIDTSFISLKFKGLYIAYQLDTAATQKAFKAWSKRRGDVTANPADAVHAKYKSQLFPHLKEIIIDASGSVFSGYSLSFLIRGDWTYKRVGDQLPFEYQPPPNTSP
jgi:hypothetical protein